MRACIACASCQRRGVDSGWSAPRAVACAMCLDATGNEPDMIGAARPTPPSFRELFTPKLFTVLREGYGLADFRADLTAGLTVAIVALPLSMAIGIASGVTPDRGLYAAIVGGFLVSALGGSRFQIGGPAGAFIVLVAATVAQHGVDGLMLATFLSGLHPAGDRAPAARQLHQVRALSGDRWVHRRHRGHHPRQPAQGAAGPDPCGPGARADRAKDGGIGGGAAQRQSRRDRGRRRNRRA